MIYLLQIHLRLWRQCPAFFVSERWAAVSLTAAVTDAASPRPDELLLLFALLILLSTAAVQIRAHGPLGSQGGGQRRKCSTSTCSVCVCEHTHTHIHTSFWGNRMFCRGVCSVVLSFYFREGNVLAKVEHRTQMHSLTTKIKIKKNKERRREAVD